MRLHPGIRQNVAALVAVLVLSAVIGLLAVVILHGEHRRAATLMEYRADRTASALYEMVVEGRAADIDLEAEGILGFGVYGEHGIAVYRVGSAPSMYPAEARRGGAVYSYDPERRTLTLSRQSGMEPGGRSGRMARAPMVRAGGSQYLYVQMDVSAPAARQALYRVGMVVVPLMICLLAAGVGYLYVKNADYRRRMARQEARQDRLMRLGETARTLAHELKNPLNAIKLRARLAQRHADAESVEDLRVIEEEVQRLSVLSQRIGDFLKDPVGRPEEHGIGALVAGILERNGWAIPLTDRCPSAVVRMDTERLRSVVENLITNALESSDDRPEGIEVEIGCTADRVDLSVLDRGRGITPADAERAFDPFYTSKTTGSGIGLAMARRFVEAAGGTIELRPRQGGGAEARVGLPRSRA